LTIYPRVAPIPHLCPPRGVSMQVARSVEECRELRAQFSGSVGLVPTMGALHEGHRSLMRRARADCNHVIATIFVNPTQFGPNDDYAAYPRSEEADLAACEEEGVSLVFVPDVSEMY